MYGGRAGLLGGCWLWDADHVSIDPAEGLPHSLSGAFYADAIPLYGRFDPRTKELDANGEYVWAGVTSAGIGTVVRSVSNGAGGWGDPLDRDPQAVLIDVRDEYVSIEGARRDYGVVISGDPQRDPEGLVLDSAATAKLRDTRRLQL